MSNDKIQHVDAATLYAEVPTQARKGKELPSNAVEVYNAASLWATAIAKSAVGAHADRNKPFSVYQRRDNGSPRLPDRDSALAIQHFTLQILRKREDCPSLRLKVVQLPGYDYAVFAFKSGTKNRFKMGEKITC